LYSAKSLSALPFRQAQGQAFIKGDDVIIEVWSLMATQRFVLLCKRRRRGGFWTWYIPILSHQGRWGSGRVISWGIPAGQNGGKDI
jgi:hypothetical protein